MVNTNQTMQRNYRSSYSFDHLRSWRQQSGNGVPERFPVWRTGFLDGFQLFEVGLIDSDRFQDGSSDGSQVWILRGFSTDYDCLSLAQLTVAVGHTRDWSRKPFRYVCCCQGGKYLESTSRIRLTVEIHRKTTFQAPGTAPKRLLIRL